MNHDRGARSFIPRPFTVGNLGLALTQVKEEQKKLSSGEQRQVHGGEHGGQGWARWGGGGGGGSSLISSNTTEHLLLVRTQGTFTLS